MSGWQQRIPAGTLLCSTKTLFYQSVTAQDEKREIHTSDVVSPLLCVVFSREELVHPAGLLRPPQRLPAVWTGRLDPGEDGPSGAAREPGAETRRPRQPGRGAQETAHTQTLQLKHWLDSDSNQALQPERITSFFFLFFNVLFYMNIIKHHKVKNNARKSTDTVLLMQFFNILLVSTLLTTLR